MALQTTWPGAATILGLAVGLAGCALTTAPHVANLGPTLHRRLTAFERVLDVPGTFRVQVLVSRVETDSAGRSSLKRSAYRLGAEYFYPASAIKLCAAVAALQVIEGLGAERGSADLLDVPFEIAPLFPGDPPQVDDPANVATGRMTVATELRKLALVSDNQAFNRLFDVVGYEGLNDRMHALGFASVVINHRLSETRTIPDARASAAVTFRPPNADAIIIPARTSERVLENTGTGLMIGTGYISGSNLVAGPMDFTRRNGISLMDLQNLLVKVVRPDITIGGPAVALSERHRAWLLEAMTMYPRESSNPTYSAEVPDDAVKFLLPGIRRVFPSTVRGERIEVTGKIGGAYGFTVENSYLRNPLNGRAVFVAAVIYTNADGILNDDKYEYDTVGRPFMADLGEMVSREWLK